MASAYSLAAPCPPSTTARWTGPAAQRCSLRVAAQPSVLRAPRAVVVTAAAPDASAVKIITQGRHMPLTSSLKSYVDEKVSRAVAPFAAVVKEVDVKLSVSGGDVGKGAKQQRTEITIYTFRNGVVRAEDVESSMYASIDVVSDKVHRKLRKLKGKAIDKGKWPGHARPRHAPPFAEGVADDVQDVAVEEELTAEEEGPLLPSEVIREKKFSLQPMTVEEAVEQVEQVGHDFFLFRDKVSGQVRVLYKRKTSGYGVLIPDMDEATQT